MHLVASFNCMRSERYRCAHAIIRTTDRNVPLIAPGAEIMNSDAIEALNAVVPGGIFPSGTTPDQYCSDLCSQSCYGAGGLAMWIKGPCITEYAPVA